MVDDFLRLLCRSSSISCCSDAVGFNSNHSSMISRIGLVIFALDLFVSSIVTCCVSEFELHAVRLYILGRKDGIQVDILA